MSDFNAVKQVSVYLENSEGTLADMLDCIGAENINILALCIADTTDFGIVRLVVAAKDQDALMDKLAENGLIARTNDVLGVCVAHQPGGLAKVLDALRDRNQQVEYAYSIMSAGKGEAAIIMQTSDNAACAAALADAGIKLLANEDLV